VERKDLWFRVLVARYGVVGGRLQEGGRDGSVLWREIAGTCDGVGVASGGWLPLICSVMSVTVLLLCSGWTGGWVMSLFGIGFVGYLSSLIPKCRLRLGSGGEDYRRGKRRW